MSLEELSGLRQRQAHGMSKTTSFKDVEDLLTSGIGQTKYTSGGADGLYTAQLFGQVDPGTGSAIGTSSGKAVTSGHAVLVAKDGKQTIKSLDDISEILLNDGDLGDSFIPMLRYFQQKFPQFKFIPYSQAKAYYSTTKKHGGQLKYQHLRK